MKAVNNNTLAAADVSLSAADAPPSAHVLSLSELPDTAGKQTAPLLDDLNPLHRVKAKLQVCVGEVSISVGELLATKEHDVLALDRRLEQPVDLLLEGKVVARGQLVAVEDHFAVRITELPVSLKA